MYRCWFNCQIKGYIGCKTSYLSSCHFVFGFKIWFSGIIIFGSNSLTSWNKFVLPNHETTYSTNRVTSQVRPSNIQSLSDVRSPGQMKTFQSRLETILSEVRHCCQSSDVPVGVGEVVVAGSVRGAPAELGPDGADLRGLGVARG